MKALPDVIAEHPFFADLSPAHLAVVAGCAQIAGYRSGEFLFKYGGAAEHFFVLRHGRVSLEMAAPGRDPFRFQTAGPGDVVGWSWLFPPHTWQFDARAVDEVGVIRFDGRCLRAKCDADPALGYALMQRFARVLVQRFTDTRLQLMDVYGKQPR
jgi:CRP-like cAMP-binding protein